ncbi:MAG: tRNA pseudouridine(55) synthase TruB [Bdellovibrionota bacterium]
MSNPKPVLLDPRHLAGLNGALLIRKEPGITSFGIIEELQRDLIAATSVRKRDLPKLGHGGTLDPFATGLIVVCVGRSVKLARYFLGAAKHYKGVIRFGESTVPGDPTAPITERSDVIPTDIGKLRDLASRLQSQPYLQTPPMYSAKKKDGKPLYELARAGIEVEREPKLCHLHRFVIQNYADRRAEFAVSCSSGTYIRTLAQDFGRLLGTVALLESLDRTGSGEFSLEKAMTLGQIRESLGRGTIWSAMDCWNPFDSLLGGFDSAWATADEARALAQGRKNVLFTILRRTKTPEKAAHRFPQADTCVGIYLKTELVAIARRDENDNWDLDRVFFDPGQPRPV